MTMYKCQKCNGSGKKPVIVYNNGRSDPLEKCGCVNGMRNYTDTQIAKFEQQRIASESEIERREKNRLFYCENHEAKKLLGKRGGLIGWWRYELEDNGDLLKVHYDKQWNFLSSEQVFI